MRRRKSRMGPTVGCLLAVVLIFSFISALSAQEAEAPPSAVELVEAYVNRWRGNLPLASEPNPRDFGPILLGFTVAVGSSALALLPPIFQWDIAPAKSLNSYGGWGLLWGVVGSIGMTGLAYNLDVSLSVDRRAMYGLLLDIPDEKEKEKAAIRILKRLHDERREYRIRTGVVSFLLVAVPVTGYFITEVILGRDSAYVLSDIGFAAGFALSLVAPWNRLTLPTYEERLYQGYLSSLEGSEK